ncbi:MAG: hypothetical protein Ta2B_11210 [Termitinemataceae bacterium]|nr:MAG: hypothetical protein Ta2B_11210 [Termitinemataceae bacterium]
MSRKPHNFIFPVFGQNLGTISHNVKARLTFLLRNKNPRRRAALYFCSPGELHFGFNTPRYAPEARTRDIERAEGIKPYGSNKETRKCFAQQKCVRKNAWERGRSPT